MNKTKPHIYFWATAVLTLLAGYEFYRKIENPDLVFNYHDTYFVISNFYFTILISYALAFIGLIYYLHSVFEISLSKFLTDIHTWISIGCIILYFLTPFFEFEKENAFPLFDESTFLNSFLITISLTFLFMQALLVFNSTFSLIKHFFKAK